jgi:gamma-tubulin complex component 3
LIGKSINFLRELCNVKELTWLNVANSFRTKYDSLLSSLEDTLESKSENSEVEASLPLEEVIPKMEKILSETFRIVNHQLNSTLFSKYKLFEHCFALKRYLLLGQGDFIQYLMDLLG